MRQNRSEEMTMMAIVIDVRLVPVVTRLGRHHHPVEPETSINWDTVLSILVVQSWRKMVVGLLFKVAALSWLQW